MRGLQCLLQLLTKLARGSVHHCFILVLGSAPNHRELHRGFVVPNRWPDVAESSLT